MSVTHVPRVGTGRGPREHHLPRRNWCIAHGRDKREVALRGFVLSRSNNVRGGQHGVPTKVSKDVRMAGVQQTKLCRTGAGGHVDKFDVGCIVVVNECANPIAGGGRWRRHSFPRERDIGPCGPCGGRLSCCEGGSPSRNDCEKKEDLEDWLSSIFTF